jgi:hypothetical protein
MLSKHMHAGGNWKSTRKKEIGERSEARPTREQGARSKEIGESKEEIGESKEKAEA